jgi:hypothetical protein
MSPTKMPTNNFDTMATNYLNKHGLNGWRLEISDETKYNNIIVVPAIQEYENIRRLLGSLMENDNSCFGDTLLIIVVNNTENSSAEVKADNKKSIDFLTSIIRKTALDELAVKVIVSGLNLGIVDASSDSKELPDKDGGVGLARKIGMDLALTQFDDSNDKKKILICLDADCTVARNYLTSLVTDINKRNLSAAYVRYEHIIPENDDVKKAIVCYEIFLRYYVLGLKYAHSPFAFPTIGSTMICDAESYIKIGGMNKKKAAEDFYFMEKLAKITEVKEIDSTKVYPSSRASWRVPFGTGQRINRYFAETHDEYKLYEPASFDVLKDWLKAFNTNEVLSANQYLKLAESINPELHTFLINNSFESDWNNIVNRSKSSAQIQKQKTIWFDGFRTLKLIHFLRDNSMPQIGMFDALDAQLGKINYETNIKRLESIPPIGTQIEYLKHLRNIA